ncbi:hypothetical protein LNQ03_24090 [Klebsiella pneumoniae subsp. pneumoniae]|nr:hypothetical protein [Klebsiella pneumoniae subsp. pneumoniae]
MRTAPLALLILAFTLMGGGGSLCSSTAQSSAFLHTPAEEMPDASALWNLNRLAQLLCRQRPARPAAEGYSRRPTPGRGYLLAPPSLPCCRCCFACG